MIAFPDPNDPDNEGGTPFEIYDLLKLVGYALIAWALAVSIGVALLLS